MKTVDFSETFAASDLEVGRYRQLILFMKELRAKWPIKDFGKRVQIYKGGSILLIIPPTLKKWGTLVSACPCAPNFEKVGDILVSASVCVCVCVCVCVYVCAPVWGIEISS